MEIAVVIGVFAVGVLAGEITMWFHLVRKHSLYEEEN